MTMPSDFDGCECGDYRLQHERGAGRCKMPNDMTHGFKPCTEFRMFGPPATEVSQPYSDGANIFITGRMEQEHWVSKDGQKASKYVVVADSVRSLDSAPPRERKKAAEGWPEDDEPRERGSSKSSSERLPFDDDDDLKWG